VELSVFEIYCEKLKDLLNPLGEEKPTIIDAPGGQGCQLLNMTAAEINS